jgi:hypothetical protein
LVNFSGTDGASPVANLIADDKGNLLGTTVVGGAYGQGTVFEVAKTADGYAGTPATLVSFSCKVFNCADGNGSFPVAGLLADANGNLRGTTSGGGPSGSGTVFEIAKTAHGYASTPTTLVSLDFNSNGGGPEAALIADADGNLFSTASQGGAYRHGTVFEVSGSGFAVPAPPIGGGVSVFLAAGGLLFGAGLWRSVAAIVDGLRRARPGGDASSILNWIVAEWAAASGIKLGNYRAIGSIRQP